MKPVPVARPPTDYDFASEYHISWFDMWKANLGEAPSLAPPSAPAYTCARQALPGHVWWRDDESQAYRCNSCGVWIGYETLAVGADPWRE